MSDKVQDGCAAFPGLGRGGFTYQIHFMDLEMQIEKQKIKWKQAEIVTL
jgi:hypothetical protein